MEPEHWSQHGEDLWIAEHLNIPEKGIFVEVGAYDGVLSSNTLFFERKGWTGILIEPDPKTCGACMQNRKARTLCMAVNAKEGWQEFHINTEDRGLSGLDRPGFPVTIFASPLKLLIREFLDSDHIDLLSIDTEGTELDVWESIGSIRPTIVIIEYNTLGLPLKDEEIIARFIKDGYFQVHRTETNLIFVKSK